MHASVLIRRFGFGLIVLAYGAILALFASGGFRLLDDALRDLRFPAQPRGVTGGVVFVDIDSRSLDSVGVWPWPRHVHAQVVDRLMALGAEDVVLDIDFSVPSSETEDAAFARSL